MRRNTTLILGAGASLPYGYPSGSSLVDAIVHGLRGQGSHINRSLDMISANASLRNELAEKLEDSQLFSIDAFLEKNQSFLQIGKVCIASAILSAEKIKVRAEFPEHDWYRELLNKVISDGQEGDGRLRIITYNYDVSLEAYLWSGLKAAFASDVGVAESIYRKIEVIHVHGHVGGRPLYDTGRSYGIHNSFEFSAESSKQIRIIFEAEGVLSQYERVLSGFINGECVFILGFGYARENVRRLKPEVWSGNMSMIYGSGFGLSVSHRGEVIQAFGRRNCRIGDHTRTLKQVIFDADHSLI